MRTATGLGPRAPVQHKAHAAQHSVRTRGRGARSAASRFRG
ncbi:hypothetical protein SLNWT_5386 [Streptomyces albus]|uniref:Uncharacterized protein n=1 Tax=Streptomyces albus (strain ATCC 21838 / DSM 41398 / FERM P-419 / JCM 4703 / NBRC 107858) TaxID=1081613 RepID=A0A0B5F5Y3_STRA4|nr:hypothetical protein SLNWT_5386 [Streptomyces albus]AOU80065.1 hypothetical protein SLNHY_5374 [Streptomyces albus]AYN35783.1 hypothetical protein DUI70_5287 [Streptomyces albus]